MATDPADLGEIARTGAPAPILPRDEAPKLIATPQQWGPFNVGDWIAISADTAHHVKTAVAAAAPAADADANDFRYPEGVFDFIVDEDNTYVQLFSATAGAKGWVRKGSLPR